MKLYYATNMFDLQIFDSQTIAFLNVFEICTEMRSILYFFYVKDVLQRPF